MTIQNYKLSKKLQDIQAESKRLQAQFAKSVRPVRIEEAVAKKNMRKTSDGQIIYLSADQ